MTKDTSKKNIEYLDQYEDTHQYRNIQVPDTSTLGFEPLKQAPSKDAYCKVHLIKNSDLTMGLSVFVRTSDTESQITLPVYTFLLEVSCSCSWPPPPQPDTFPSPIPH